MEKKHSKLQWAALVVASVGMVSCIATQQTAQEESAAAAAAVQAQMTPEQRAAEARKEADFQRVLAGARTLKQQAKNPASFKLTGAMVTAAGAACYQFEGTNSFNAVVPGAVVEVGGTFLPAASAWKAHCAGKAGESYRHAGAVL